jgi:hypothetical protein
MKNQRRILFRIIFFLAVLFCFGISTCSNYLIQPTNAELSAGTNGEKISFSSDIDFFSDDQIPQTDKFSAMVELNGLIPFSNNPLLIPNFSFSIWQPPKIS